MIRVRWLHLHLSDGDNGCCHWIPTSLAKGNSYFKVTELKLILE